MNARERLLAALRGDPVDRVPAWLLFPYHHLGCYVDVQTNPCYQSIFELSRERAVMLNRRGLGVPRFTPEVSTIHEEVEEQGWEVKRRIVRCGAVELVSEVRRRDGEMKIKKLLATDDDLEAYCQLPIETDEARVKAHLDSWLPRYQQERAEFPSAYGAMMLSLGEPIGTLYHESDLEAFAVWSLTHNEAVRDLLERDMVQRRQVYTYCLERGLAEVYFLVGSELAAPPLVSRATFQQWIVPYAQELIERVHQHGQYAIQHFHGHIREILPDFVTMAPDGLHTIEAPPVGNCTLSEAYDVVGDRMTLIGNIQYDDFRAFSATEMAAAVRRVLDEAAGRRFILSPTAGPYEETIEPRVIENYRSFLETAWAYGVHSPCLQEMKG